jgi:hypothetical protein
MGIDLPDDDDVPTVDGKPVIEHEKQDERELVVDRGTGTDWEEARAEYNTRYRASVASDYQAAWDETFPEFQRAWAELKERYPRPERPQPTLDQDGSWRSGDLKLEPWQNAEVDRSRGRIREIAREAIIPGMRDVEAADPSRCLVGFDNRFKGEDRLKEKVADRLRSKPGRTPTEVVQAIPDAVRFTFQYPEESYTASVRKDVERLEARGFVQVERRNTWTSEQYKGINSRWREPESQQLFEVQFHTRISFEAKELTHKAYERIRAKAEDPERAELKEFQRRVSAMIPIPPGAADYEDYTEKRDG